MDDIRTIMNDIVEIDGYRTTLKIIDEDNLEDIDEEEDGVTVAVSSILGTRKSQQDTVFGQYEDDIGIGIVCDGMGGLNGGERASALAVETLASAYYNSMPISDYASFFREQAVIADKLVAELTDDKGRKMGGGTTMVAATISEGRLFFLSVGDSRIYRISGGKIDALNRLHNYRMTMDAKLEEGTMTMDQYKQEEKEAESLISFIGMGNVSLMDINKEGLELKNRDVILLCSDGLYKALSEDEIKDIISKHTFDMKDAAEELTKACMNRRRRKQDNTSVVLMQYKNSKII